MLFLIIGLLAVIFLALLCLVIGSILGPRVLEQRANDVRELLSQNGTRYQIVNAIIGRCSHLNGDIKAWRHAAIAQTQQVLDIPLKYATALVSEFAPVDDLIMRNHNNLLDI